MKRIILYTLLFFIVVPAFTQNNKGYLDLAKAENQLKSMFDKLYSEEILGINMNLYHSIDTLFESALNIPGSFEYSWDQLDKIGKLQSDDGIVKVFSWLYVVSRNEYHYTCYFQVKTKKDEYKIFKLKPGIANNIKAEDFSQNIENWHSKIYYEIITTEYKRKTFYTLIGADFNNTETSMKTIEVFAIQRGKPVFRGDQFLDGGMVKDRIVFEYSAELASSVRFNKKLDMIVFDHLAPLHPIYNGIYQFYGPDGSYDGFRFVDGIWVKEEDVDARNRE